MKFKGKITFNVKASHPDIQYIKDPNSKLDFEDTYTLDNEWNEDDAINFIKRDLSIVAGGGYDNEHIYNAKYDIKRVG